jgi:ABC-type transport system involved in multi-copper enzyme maturation permease subunit
VSRIIAIASSVVADATRRKVMWAVLVIAVIMAATIPGLPSYGVGVVQAIFREFSMAVTYAAAVLITVALCANRIPGEIERRTVYNVLSKRTARWEYLVGTWAGVVTVMGLLVVAFIAVDIAIGAVAYHEWMWRLFEGGLAIWFEAAVLAAAAIAISTRVGPVTTTIGALAFLVVAHARGMITLPSVVGRFYPSLDIFSVINPVAHGAGISWLWTGVMVVAFVGWSLVLLGIASALFAARDL